MYLKKFIPLFVIALTMSVFVTACSDDDDDDDFTGGDVKELVGNWKCVDCDVESFSFTGADLPSSVKDMIITRLETEMIGSVTTIDRNNVSLTGNVLIFKDSNIKWTIKELTATHMEVIYGVDQSYGGIGIKMTVEAEFNKIN